MAKWTHRFQWHVLTGKLDIQMLDNTLPTSIFSFWVRQCQAVTQAGNCAFDNCHWLWFSFFLWTVTLTVPETRSQLIDTCHGWPLLQAGGSYVFGCSTTFIQPLATVLAVRTMSQLQAAMLVKWLDSDGWHLTYPDTPSSWFTACSPYRRKCTASAAGSELKKLQLQSNRSRRNGGLFVLIFYWQKAVN